MDFLNALKERIPDYAKDIRLNLDATIDRSSLDPTDALGAALAAAFAARSKSIIDAFAARSSSPTRMRTPRSPPRRSCA